MEYEQYFLHHEIEMKHWWFQARRFIVREMIHQIIPSGRDRVIVDLGCGTGGNSSYFAREYCVYGIDTSIEAIEFAKNKNSDGIFFHKCESDPIDRNILKNADLVLLMDVLEHVADDYALISEIIYGIKPQTYILITVPADLKLWSQHDESYGHYRRYDMERFEDIWRKLPVDQVLLSYYNSRLYPFIKAIRTINKMRGSTKGLAGTDFRMRSKIINHILKTIFSGEYRTLLNALTDLNEKGYTRGASLMAILRRI